METKKCPKCNTVKLAEEFGKRKQTEDGLSRWCKECSREANKAWRQQNREVYNENTKKYGRRWRKRNPKKVKAASDRQYRKDSEKLKARSKNWRDNNPVYLKQWQEANKDRLASIKSEWRRNHYQTDLNYRLLCVLRTRLYKTVRNAKGSRSGHTIELLGCSPEELIMHIEKQFREGMNWENYGEVWEIDHIKPCASFDLTKPEEQRVCFHYTNLQPLFGEENRKKRDKENYDFTKQ